MLNNILFILGVIALSNGNISLGDNIKDAMIESDIETVNGKGRGMKKDNRIKLKGKLRPKKHSSMEQEHKEEVDIEKEVDQESDIEIDVETLDGTRDDGMKFNLNDISKGLKMLELSDDDLDRGMEIITRTKKYMSRDEKKVLIKLESILDLVRGIKKLSSVDQIEEIDESDFFRTMEEDDKKNMMIKEILEVFPDSKRDSIEKAIDMKKKIELFAELFLPDDIGELGEIGGSGFSLSSLANFSNLGSLGNLKLLGNLLRTDSPNKSNNDKRSRYEESEEIVEDNECTQYNEETEIIEEYEESEEVYSIEDNEDEYIRID